MDETYVAAEPVVVARLVADPSRWPGWWPGLRVVVTEDRGVEGVRWSVEGKLAGSAEVWLEPGGAVGVDGVVVHFYLRAEPAPGRRAGRSARGAARLAHAYTLRWKRGVNALKDEAEGGRRPGDPIRR